MADKLGSAVLTLSVDDSQYNAGLQRAKKSLDGLSAAGKGGDLGGLTGSMAALGGTAVGITAGIAAVGVAVVGIGAAAVQSAGGIQRLNAAFVGLTGSAEAAKQLRQDLFTLSKTTPFKNEEILQAAQRFLAVGIEVDKLQGTINRVGAIAAQSGQPLERLALIYAQVYAKGRLQGEENLQLLEAGVDLTQELSTVTGLSGKALQDAMSKGQIGIADFNKALLLATGEMSSLQLAGQAVDVQFNNIFDNLGQLFGGFAQAISPALSAAFKVVNGIFDSAFPSLESITEFFAPLTQAAKEFADTLAGNPQLLATIAASFKSIGEIIIGNVVIGVRLLNDLLSQIDGRELVNGLITAELVIRKTLLAARALGATLAKNAELSLRAISNPFKFSSDIGSAGGFGKFIAKEYAQVVELWKAASEAKPLPFPEIKPRAGQEIKGALDNKDTPEQPLLNAGNNVKNKLVEGASIAGNALNDAANRLKGTGLALGSAIGNYQSALKSGFEYLSGDLRQQLLDKARVQIRSLQDQQIFRGDLRLKTPQDILQAGAAAEQIQGAQSQLRQAQIDNTNAIIELARKNWEVNVNVPGGSASGDVVGAINGALA